MCKCLKLIRYLGMVCSYCHFSSDEFSFLLLSLVFLFFVCLCFSCVCVWSRENIRASPLQNERDVETVFSILCSCVQCDWDLTTPLTCLPSYPTSSPAGFFSYCVPKVFPTSRPHTRRDHSHYAHLICSSTITSFPLQKVQVVASLFPAPTSSPSTMLF